MLKRNFLAGLVLISLLGGIGQADEKVSEEKAALSARIILVDGKDLSGELVRMEKGIAYVKSLFAAQEIKIPLQKVECIYLHGLFSEMPSDRDRVFLSTGDILSGKLVSLDEKKIELRTHYAGSLKIKKERAEAMILNRKPLQVVFSDDFSKTNNEWGVNTVYNQPRKWHVSGGKLHKVQPDVYRQRTYTKVKQEGPMTYEWEIEFDPEDKFSGQFGFFSSGEAGKAGPRYSVKVTPPGIYLSRGSGGGKHAVFHPFSEKVRKVQLKVAYDPRTGRINILANGKRIISYLEGSSDVRPGSYIILSVESAAEITFDNIKVLRGWNDFLRETRPGAGKNDVLHLVNGDRLTGELEKADGQKLNFLTKHGRLSVQRQKVSQVLFSEQRTISAQAKGNMAQITLGNLDRLTLRIKSLDDKFLTGETEYAGRVKIERSAIKEILFNAVTPGR